MVIPRLIERKRDGGALDAGEWRALVAGYASGQVPDYQMAALLMAVVFRGLAAEELDALTEAMLASGDRLNFDGWATPRVGKHSTGGVGDKTSLVLAPLLAACGVAVPKMSGHGLGHTGGTLDKLEAIPGFRTRLTLREAEAQVRAIGCAMLGQSDEIAPADRRMYALRDVTGTVESVPLISASIMSKKLAEGLTGLVLDVKTGSGAFLPEPERALALARTMIGLGAARGCPTVALVTAMDRPLGHACGNALEVEEALLTLKGEGPPDLRELTLALGVEMLRLAEPALAPPEAGRRLEQVLASGRALQSFARLVEAQGGNPAVVDDPGALPQAAEVEIHEAPADGFVQRVEPRTIGRAITALGGGRSRVDDAIDPAVGFVITAKPGHQVRRGEPLASVFARDPAGVEQGLAALAAAIEIGEAPPAVPPLIAHRVTADGVEPAR
ncbi:MAG TPA: thymidine phosphorylase [Gemmatimonadales bacterium]|nr:thymidine phosphorylase [Gemmatimonadales bacterium]